MGEPRRGLQLGFAYEGPVSQSVEWYTPPEVFAALGLDFDLDVCSPGAEVVPWVPARRHITVAEDGLSVLWSGRAWCNPPYGPGIGRWLERMAEHADGVALVPSRTDTGWFQDAAASADALVFVAGRLQFRQPSGSVPGANAAGSVLLAWSDDCAAALHRCRLGVVGLLRA